MQVIVILVAPHRNIPQHANRGIVSGKNLAGRCPPQAPALPVDSAKRSA
jgi:hypothetical protein